uniref:Uncharacterized protein n=1 Tax=Eutreptiella gymnastica TaxID=73025 RepID=A0A7S4GJY9_9EUGL
MSNFLLSFVGIMPSACLGTYALLLVVFGHHCQVLQSFFGLLVWERLFAISCLSLCSFGGGRVPCLSFSFCSTSSWTVAREFKGWRQRQTVLVAILCLMCSGPSDHCVALVNVGWNASVLCARSVTGPAPGYNQIFLGVPKCCARVHPLRIQDAQAGLGDWVWRPSSSCSEVWTEVDVIFSGLSLFLLLCCLKF